MKIAFFIGNMSHSGGTERVLSAIANGLSARGHQVLVISLWGDGNVYFPLEEGIKIFWVENKAGHYNIIKQLYYLALFLKHKKPDFLIDVDSILGAYSILLKGIAPGLNWISWEHFSCYYHFEKNHLLRRLVKRLVFRSADQMVVLTETDKRYYEKHFKLRCGITCIYNPVPYETKFSRETEERMIMAAGRLTEVKGFDLLIQSWSLLESRYPKWSLLVAGEGEDREKLEKEVEKRGLKRIRFIGDVCPIEDYYKRAAFLVLPSRSEGFGMVLIEAMYFSIPVVSYACESGPGEIINDGENGFLVEPGNIIEFAEKMEVLMKNERLRRQMGRTAVESVGKFEKETILDRWEALLEDILSTA